MVIEPAMLPYPEENMYAGPGAALTEGVITDKDWTCNEPRKGLVTRAALLCAHV